MGLEYLVSLLNRADRLAGGGVEGGEALAGDRVHPGIVDEDLERKKKQTIEESDVCYDPRCT